MQLINKMNNFVDMLNALKPYTYLKNTIGVLVFMLCVTYSSAQTEKIIEAQKLLEDKKIAQSIILIEQATKHNETKDDPFTWYLRSLAYYQFYSQVGDFSSSKIALLDSSFSSGLKSNKLKPEPEIKTENDKILEKVAKKYFSITRILLQDSLNSSKSELLYQKHKKAFNTIQPDYSFKERDVEYYVVMSNLFTDLFMKSDFKIIKYGDVAKSACFMLLEIDPKNITANYNLGVIFYNQAATLMKEMDYDIDIAKMDVVQENAKKLFKQSEPFMYKVHELNPKDIRALEGLQGIYYALNDNEKELVYKQKKAALEQKNKK